jgi:RNA polymerase sigma-70 factor (ECF subfamily)
MSVTQSSIFDSQPPIGGLYPHTHRRERRTGASDPLASSPAISEVHKAPSSALPELSLIQRAIAGDAMAQEKLFKDHSTKLYRTAFGVLRNKEDAEDALQDCWLRVCTNLKSFESRSSFYTWVTRIVINSALMILRKKRNVREVSMDAMEDPEKVSLIRQFPDTSPNPEQSVVESERKELLNRAIRRLRPRIRAIVQLGQLQELSSRETAQRLGISVPAAKGRLFHARAALRKSAVLKPFGKARNGGAAKA